MTQMTSHDLSGWIGRDAADRDGHKIGTVFDIYLDDATGAPEWLAVKTGMFGTKVSFVPLGGATAAGNDVVVAYDEATVQDAPKAEPDGALSIDEEDALYRHYGYRDDGDELDEVVAPRCTRARSTTAP